MSESWKERQARLESERGASSPERGRRSVIVVVAAVALVAVGAGFVYWFWGGDTADEVSLESAVDAAGGDGTGDGTTGDGTTGDGTTGDDGPGDPSSSGEAITSADGIWVVDTSRGTVEVVDDDDGSFVGFRVDEQLTVGASTAVARVPEVSGTIEISGSTLVAAEITAELTSIRSDAPRRDNAMRDAMGVSEFPTATFVLDGPVELGSVPEPDVPVEATLSGDLTVKGTTSPISVDVVGVIVGDRIAVVGTSNITFADWGISAPSAPLVVSVEPQGTLELQLFFAAGD